MSLIFTDGSKNDDSVGYAVVNNNITESERIPSCCSIYTAETLAILQALKMILQADHQKRFLVVTDSLSALQGLKCTYTTNPIQQLIKEKLKNITMQNKTVEFLWVPSHIGIDGNERADEEANRISKSQRTSDMKVPYCDLKASSKNYCMKSGKNPGTKKTPNFVLFKLTYDKHCLHPSPEKSK